MGSTPESSKKVAAQVGEIMTNHWPTTFIATRRMGYILATALSNKVIIAREKLDSVGEGDKVKYTEGIESWERTLSRLHEVLPQVLRDKVPEKFLGEVNRGEKFRLSRVDIYNLGIAAIESFSPQDSTGVDTLTRRERLETFVKMYRRFTDAGGAENEGILNRVKNALKDA